MRHLNAPGSERLVDPRRDGIDADRVAPKLYVGSYEPDDAKLARSGFSDVVRVAMELPKCEFPMNDAPLTPEQAKLASAAASEVCRALARGGRVLVTCAMGLNRSALVAALAMVRYYDCTPANAIRAVRAGRRVPPYGLQVLSNESFVEHLMTLRLRLVQR